MSSKFTIYQGKDDQWYWRLVAGNGETIAQGEGYTTEQAAARGVLAVQRAVLAVVQDGLSIELTEPSLPPLSWDNSGDNSVAS